MAQAKMGALDKAAIIMLGLGEELAANLLAQMPAAEAKRVLSALQRLGRVDQATVDSVLTEFHAQLLHAANAPLQADLESLRRMLGRVMDPERADALLDDLADGSRNLSEALRDADPAILARIMARQHPQTIAITLAHAPPRVAGETLKRLPQSEHLSLIQKIAHLGTVAPEMLEELAETLRQELEQAGERRLRDLGGPDKVASLVNSLPRAEGERLLHDLEERDPELAAKVREHMFGFADLTKINGRGIQELLKEVPRDTLLLALRDAPEAVILCLYRNMSERAVAQIKDDLEAMPKARRDDVEAAQRLIADTALRLADAGRLQIENDAEAYV